MKSNIHLCGHDEDAGIRVNGDVSRHQSDFFLKMLHHFSIFLIAERFDGRRVDHALISL